MQAVFAPGLSSPGPRATTLRQSIAPPTPASSPHTVWQGTTGAPRFAPPTPWSRLLGRLRRVRARWRRAIARRGSGRLIR